MASLHWIRRRLRSLRGLSARRRTLLIEAAVRLLAAQAVLRLVPFPYLAPRFGTFVPPSNPRAAMGQSGASTEHAAAAREIGWAVTTAARHVPFQAVCLPQAMAARMMLKRRGVPSVIHFGAAKGADALDTHAWLDAAGIEVTGFPVGGQFAEVACFV
jgi:hypothetical protein